MYLVSDATREEIMRINPPEDLGVQTYSFSQPKKFLGACLHPVTCFTEIRMYQLRIEFDYAADQLAIESF